MAFKYLNIIKSIELSEIRQENKNKKNKSSMDTYFLSVASILLFISLILLFIYKYYGEHGFIFALTITSLSGCYLTLLLMPFIKIYTNKSKIKKSIALPFNFSINSNVKKEIITDERKFPELLNLKVQELEIGLIEIKHEKNSLEKRISILIGPIEKLGILPGILATVGMTLKIEDQAAWISGIAYGYIALTIISLKFQNTLAHYERMIALTEAALRLKK